MVQSGGDTNLPQESFSAEQRREIRLEYLNGHRAVVPEVLREIHDRHAAMTHFPLDAVAGQQRLVQGFESGPSACEERSTLLRGLRRELVRQVRVQVQHKYEEARRMPDPSARTRTCTRTSL